MNQYFPFFFFLKKKKWVKCKTQPSRLLPGTVHRPKGRVCDGMRFDSDHVKGHLYFCNRSINGRFPFTGVWGSLMGPCLACLYYQKQPHNKNCVRYFSRWVVGVDWICCKQDMMLSPLNLFISHHICKKSSYKYYSHFRHLCWATQFFLLLFVVVITLLFSCFSYSWTTARIVHNKHEVVWGVSFLV